MSDYEIVEAEVVGGRVEWTAENRDGESFSGVMTERVNRGVVLTEDGLEQMAESMIGVSVKMDRAASSIMSGRLPNYSIGGDFDA